MKYSFSSLAEFALLREEFRAYLRAHCPSAAERLFVALNEAVNNALLHGTRQDGDKKVTVTAAVKKSAVEICVRHNGAGLDQRALRPGDKTGLRESGRGLCIIDYCADSVTYNNTGTEIVMRTEIGKR